MLRTALTVVLAFVALLLLLVVFNLFVDGPAPTRRQTLAYSDFVHEVQADQIVSVLIEGRKVTALKANGTRQQALIPEDPALVALLLDKGVRIVATTPNANALVLYAIPLVVNFVLALLWFAIGWSIIRSNRALAALLRANLPLPPSNDKPALGSVAPQ